MEAELLKDWFRLFHTLFSQPEENGEMTEQMVAFVLEYLLRLHRKDLSGHRLPTRSQETFNKFVSMVNLKVRRERNVAYYAGMLGVTVNYLTVVVKKFGTFFKKETGMTPGEYRDSKTV